jgi:hypothetical protein
MSQIKSAYLDNLAHEAATMPDLHATEIIELKAVHARQQERSQQLIDWATAIPAQCYDEPTFSLGNFEIAFSEREGTDIPGIRKLLPPVALHAAAEGQLICEASEGMPANIAPIFMTTDLIPPPEGPEQHICWFTQLAPNIPLTKISIWSLKSAEWVGKLAQVSGRPENQTTDWSGKSAVNGIVKVSYWPLNQPIRAIVSWISDLGIGSEFLAWLRDFLSAHPLDHAEADHVCQLTYDMSDFKDELFRSEMYLILCAHGYPRKWDDTKVCDTLLFHFLDLNGYLDREQEKARALAEQYGLNCLMQEWDHKQQTQG